MIEALEAAVAELELCPRGDELVAALALRDRLDAKIIAAFAEFNAAEGWTYTGAASGIAGCRATPE